MKKIILKYKFNPNNKKLDILLDSTSKWVPITFLQAKGQRDSKTFEQLIVYIQLRERQKNDTKNYRIKADSWETGEEYENHDDYDFINSVMLNEGKFVVHVFGQITNDN